MNTINLMIIIVFQLKFQKPQRFLKELLFSIVMHINCVACREKMLSLVVEEVLNEQRNH